MPCWYFGKSELCKTPSVADGIAIITEARYRREGVKFIIDVGATLGLRYDVCATAAVYFHRFYMFHSFADFQRYVTATSCLFLAAKLEENTVTWARLLETIQAMFTTKQFTVFGKDPKEEVMATEKIILETLKFDLVIDLPYNHLLKFIKLLKGDPSTVEQLLKMSWTFINDCLCTTLCVQWEPELVALSLLYLSCHLIKFNVTDWIGKPADYDGKWYQYLINDINLNIIENICRQALGVYTSDNTQPSVEKVRIPSPAPAVTNTEAAPSMLPRPISLSSPPPQKPQVDEGHWKASDKNLKITQDRQRSPSPVHNRMRSPSLPQGHKRSSSRSRSRNRSRGQRSPSRERRELHSSPTRERYRVHSPMNNEKRRMRSPLSPESRRVRTPSPRLSYTERHSSNDRDGFQRSRSSPSCQYDTEFERRKRQCRAILKSGQMLTEAEFNMVKDLMLRDHVDADSYMQLDSLQRSLGIEFTRQVRQVSPRRSRAGTREVDTPTRDEPYVPERIAGPYAQYPYVPVSPVHHPPPPPVSHFYMEHHRHPPPVQGPRPGFHMEQPPMMPPQPHFVMHMPHPLEFRERPYLPESQHTMMFQPQPAFPYQQLRMPPSPQLPAPPQLHRPPQLPRPPSVVYRPNLINIVPSQGFQLPPQTNILQVVEVRPVIASQASSNPNTSQAIQQPAVSQVGLQQEWRPL